MSRAVVRGFLGRRLTEARTRYDDGRGMTIQDLARISGVSVPTLHRWEKDLTVPQIDKLRNVAEALSIPIPMEDLIVVPRSERYPVDWRAIHGLLQPTLGRITGIETSVISQIERATRAPTPKQAAAIAKVYGITVNEFMECFERVRTLPSGAGY
ncbi:helix-turn-helix domain-containing protein [Rhodococcus hoagii]|nr:helix-turn-helix domain-containing protein [Prescottella equi]MBM4654193.1 helix-turn-helix domain-containing protein [Prescottella equi]NKR23464.1 helix-turn-helix domain-containing protein [Prescottella equi]NKT55924.1 helix-turn-helix domain-containing protein [Prescottella equi]NKU37457.1 helix-turn-helix domain-containing protein [Prescottella equi]